MKQQEMTMFLDIEWSQGKNEFILEKCQMLQIAGICVYENTGTVKGLEFDNVLIIMGKGFGKERTYFEDFFKKYDMQLSEDALYENARNLLYVAVTRAIKNLRVLYIDDIQTIKDGVQKVFGTLEKVENLIGVDAC